MPGERSATTAEAIVGQLAVPARLQVVAALVLGATTLFEIAVATGLDDEQVVPAIGRLMRSGLVATRDGSLAVDVGAFAHAARAAAPARAVDDFGGVDPAVARVLRAFIVDGRLVAIPVPGRKRQILLEYLAIAFEPGVRYDEAAVNAVLRAWHDDVAALRRYLVEADLLSRDQGVYWRSGGWVDVR